MYQDLTIVVASVFLAAVVGLGVVVVLMLRSLIRSSKAAKDAASDATSRVSRERLARSRATTPPPVAIAEPIMAEAEPMKAEVFSAPTRPAAQPQPGEHPLPADPAGHVDTRPDIVIIGGQPIAWGQPTIRQPNPQAEAPHADSRNPARPAPAWPRLVRNTGVALLVVALVGVGSIAISSRFGATAPSGGVLGASTGVASPEPTPSASAPGTQPSKPAGAPPAVVAALRGTAVVNDRLAIDADILATELARKGARAIDLARPLRALVSDADLGSDLAGRLAAWPDADPLRSDLTSFYQAVSATARDGLRAPLSDRAAYRSAAAAMLAVVAGLRDIDSAARKLAATIPVALPPITVALPE